MNKFRIVISIALVLMLNVSLWLTNVSAETLEVSPTELYLDDQPEESEESIESEIEFSAFEEDTDSTVDASSDLGDSFSESNADFSDEEGFGEFQIFGTDASSSEDINSNVVLEGSWSGKYGNSISTAVDYRLYGDLNNLTLEIKPYSGSGTYYYKNVTPDKVKAPYDAYKPYIRTVVIRGGIYKLGCETLANCVSVETIDLSDNAGINALLLAEKGLYNCKSLKGTVCVRAGSFSYSSAFCGCESLERVEIVGEVTSIPENMFSGCASLSEVTCDSYEKIKSIGANAFYNCGKLRELSQMDSLTSVGENAFFNCSQLESFYLV